jgi:hypothetical protein
MATLVSRTVGTNASVNIDYKWSDYFNTGEWWADQTTATNSNYSGIIWSDEALLLTRTLPTSGEFRIAAITLRSYNFIGLGTDYKLMAGSNEITDKKYMLLDSTNKIYLLREGTQILIVKILKDGVGFGIGYSSVPQVLTSTGELKFVKTNTSSTKLVNISWTSARDSSQTNLKLAKSGNLDNLLLSLPNDPDGSDYNATSEELTFTDFSS